MLRKSCVFLAASIILTLLVPFSSAFDISSLALYSDDDGATTTPATEMTPNDEMTLTFTIDAQSLSELYIVIYNTALTSEAACYNTDSRNSADRCAWLEWKNISGENLLTDIRPTQTTWSVDKPNSLITTGGTSRIVFTPSKSSRYSSSSDWTISITASNSSSQSISSMTLNNSHYIELVTGKNSSTFAPGMAGSEGNHLSSMTSNGYTLSYIPFTVISNAPYTWQIKAADFTGSSGISLSTGALTAAGSDTYSSATEITSSYQDFETAVDPTKESGSQKNLFMWLDYPDGDPDTTYDSTLNLKAHITSDPSISTSEKSVTLNATTDNTVPRLTIQSPSPLAWTKSGRAVSYNLDLTDTLSGFMDSLTTHKCSVYFDGQKVGESYATKDSTYKSCSCSGTFTVPETGNKNVNLNFTVTDMAGNIGYNDTLWLQVDLSSLYIKDISLVPTAKPHDLDWYFLPQDTFRIFGTVRNSINDTVSSTISSYIAMSATGVTVNDLAASSSSPYESDIGGNIDLEYAFTGASVGTHNVTLTAEDSMDNTASYYRSIHITNYVESIHIITNFTGKIYTEGDNLSIEVGTNTASNPAYLSNITAVVRNDRGTVVQTTRMNADINGKSSFYFYIPEVARESYTVEVTGISPLDTSISVSNTSTIDTEWLDITVETDSDGYIDDGETKEISVSGRLYYCEDIGNETIVEGAEVTCYIEGPGLYNQTCTTSLDEFAAYDCSCLDNVSEAGRYDIEISAEKEIDGYTIRGWNKDEYVVLTNVSEVLSSGSSSDDAVYNDCLSISAPESLVIERNSKYSLNFTIENTCLVSQSVVVDISPDSRLKRQLELDYKNAIIIDRYSGSVEILNITSGSPSYGASFTIAFYAESSDGSNATYSMSLEVVRSESEILELSQRMSEIEYNVTHLRSMLDELLPTDDVDVSSIESKIIQAEELVLEMESSYGAGDYSLAESAIDDISSLLVGLESRLDEKIHENESSRIKGIILAIIAVVLISLTALVWYMWLPEKSLTPAASSSAENSSGSGDSTDGDRASRGFRGLLQSLKKMVVGR